MSPPTLSPAPPRATASTTVQHSRSRNLAVIIAPTIVAFLLIAAGTTAFIFFRRRRKLRRTTASSFASYNRDLMFIKDPFQTERVEVGGTSNPWDRPQSER